MRTRPKALPKSAPNTSVLIHIIQMPEGVSPLTIGAHLSGEHLGRANFDEVPNVDARIEVEKVTYVVRHRAWCHPGGHTIYVETA